MPKGIYRFYSNICSHPDDVFFMEYRAYFSRTELNHILHLFQQHDFVVEESGCWTDLLQSRPENMKTQESYIRQEWDNIPLPKVQQLLSSVPDVYRCF